MEMVMDISPIHMAMNLYCTLEALHTASWVSQCHLNLRRSRIP
jgi:hypothetical protein